MGIGSRILPVCIIVNLISGCAQDIKLVSYRYSGHTAGFLNETSNSTYRFFVDKRYVEINNYHKEDNSEFYPIKVVSIFDIEAKNVSIVEGKSNICNKRYEIIVFDESNITNSKYIGYCDVSYTFSKENDRIIAKSQGYDEPHEFIYTADNVISLQNSQPSVAPAIQPVAMPAEELNVRPTISPESPALPASPSVGPSPASVAIFNNYLSAHQEIMLFFAHPLGRFLDSKISVLNYKASEAEVEDVITWNYKSITYTSKFLFLLSLDESNSISSVNLSINENPTPMYKAFDLVGFGKSFAANRAEAALRKEGKNFQAFAVKAADTYVNQNQLVCWYLLIATRGY